MVSPSFELASQLGATEPYPYLEYGWTGNGWTWTQTDKIIIDKETALCNCATYTETREVNGKKVILDDWRLPTEAEIKLIDRLQHDPNSAVKSIMTGAYYWDARNQNGATKMSKPRPGSSSTSTEANTRCVRDVKDPTILSHIPYRLDR